MTARLAHREARRARARAIGYDEACPPAASCSTTSRSASAISSEAATSTCKRSRRLASTKRTRATILPSEIEFGSAEKMDFAISTDYDVGAPIHVAFAADSDRAGARLPRGRAGSRRARTRTAGPASALRRGLLRRVRARPRRAQHRGRVPRLSRVPRQASVWRDVPPLSDGRKSHWRLPARWRAHVNRMLLSESNVDDPDSQCSRGSAP